MPAKKFELNGAEYELSGLPSLFWASNRTPEEQSFVEGLIQKGSEGVYGLAEVPNKAEEFALEITNAK